MKLLLKINTCKFGFSFSLSVIGINDAFKMVPAALCEKELEENMYKNPLILIHSASLGTDPPLENDNPGTEKLNKFPQEDKNP